MNIIALSVFGLIGFLFLAGGTLIYAGTVSFKASEAEIVNPERGLYGHGPMVDGTDYKAIRARGFTLCYASITLSGFRTSPISAARLAEIHSAFARMREAGVKGIIRINYNEDASGQDATLEMMETHLSQLHPVLEENADVIAFFQAGMIGAWGEWHSSSNRLDTPAGRAAVWRLLLRYLPAGKFIQVRTPGFANELESLDIHPLSDSDAFANTARARIAHHNDCWLADDTDMGTYPPPGPAQEALKNQIAHHSRYAPWGGETCRPNSKYANCDNALREARRFHATYLNSGYHPGVIRDLTSGGCWSTIARKLGYRFELTAATLPDVVVPGQELSFTILLRNVGWAPLFNRRPVFLRLFSSSQVIKDFLLTAPGSDPRRWLPESGIITLSGTLKAPDVLRAGKVGLALWLPDQAPALRSRPSYSIQVANLDVWDAAMGHNILAADIPVASRP